MQGIFKIIVHADILINLLCLGAYPPCAFICLQFAFVCLQRIFACGMDLSVDREGFLKVPFVVPSTVQV